MTLATLASGTIVSIEDPDTPAAYLVISETTAIGDSGEIASAVDVTALDSPDKTKTYIGGMLDPSDKEFQGNLINDPASPAADGLSTDPGQKALFEQADLLATVKIRVVFPSGNQIDMNVALLGKVLASPDPEAQLMWTVNGKQTGKSVWTAPA